MAEGGEPARQEEDVVYPRYNWDRGSLEYVFASDFIHFVTERVDRGWRSHKLITHQSPLTPFNTAIQKAVEGIVRKEKGLLFRVFAEMTEHCKELNQVRFNMCIVFLKVAYFGRLHCFGGLLKFFTVISLFSAWALVKGLHAAPFFCVDIIIGYMTEFWREHNFTSMDNFWYFFEREAGDALRLPEIQVLKKENLRCLLELQRRAEEEEESPSEEDSSEHAEADASGEKVSPEKEKSPPESSKKEKSVLESPDDKKAEGSDDKQADGPGDEQKPDGPGDEQKPDGPGGEQKPDGPGGEQKPDGPGGEQKPDGPGGEQKPDGPDVASSSEKVITPNIKKIKNSRSSKEVTVAPKKSLSASASSNTKNKSKPRKM